jgi:hypothetical protein
MWRAYSPPVTAALRLSYDGVTSPCTIEAETYESRLRRSGGMVSASAIDVARASALRFCLLPVIRSLKL